MIYTPEYITDLFESDDISSPTLIRMIEIAGISHTKLIEAVEIKTLDYLGKILRGERKATAKRYAIKNYLYDVCLATNKQAA